MSELVIKASGFSTCTWGAEKIERILSELFYTDGVSVDVTRIETAQIPEGFVQIEIEVDSFGEFWFNGEVVEYDSFATHAVCSSVCSVYPDPDEYGTPNRASIEEGRLFAGGLFKLCEDFKVSSGLGPDLRSIFTLWVDPEIARALIAGE